MEKPAKELTLEEKIDSQIEDVEQQYAENEDEISRLKVLLNQRTAKRMQLKGEHNALKRLRPEDKKKLPDNKD